MIKKKVDGHANASLPGGLGRAQDDRLGRNLILNQFLIDRKDNTRLWRRLLV